MKEMLKEKPRPKQKIKQEILDEFERRYGETCNQNHMRKKMRNVSPDNVFNKVNLPPKEHIEEDTNISKKINNVSPTDFDSSKIPLAGRLSELGQ